MVPFFGVPAVTSAYSNKGPYFCSPPKCSPKEFAIGAGCGALPSADKFVRGALEQWLKAL